jgi:hypothetical protein
LIPVGNAVLIRIEEILGACAEFGKKSKGLGLELPSVAHTFSSRKLAALS